MGALKVLVLSALMLAVAFESEGSTLKSKADKPKTSLINMSVTLEATSSLHELDSGERSSQGVMYFDPKINLSENYSVSGRMILVQELAGVQNSYLENSYVNLNRKAFNISKAIKLAPTLRGYIPTKETSRKEQTFLGAAQARFTFLSKIKPFGALINTTYRFSARKNFHEFETKANGSQNTSYSFGQLLAFDKSFLNDKLSLALVGSYSAGFTYNNELKSVFALAQEIGFTANDDLSFAIGHTNEANALKANGVDSNVTAFDEQTSYVYGNMTVKF